MLAYLLFRQQIASGITNLLLNTPDPFLEVSVLFVSGSTWLYVRRSRRTGNIGKSKDALSLMSFITTEFRAYMLYVFSAFLVAANIYRLVRYILR